MHRLRNGILLLGLILCSSGFAATTTVGIYVGNNHFPGLPGNDLRGCINDANLYAQGFQAAVGGIESHVLSDVSKGGFLNAMQSTITRCQSGEVGRIIIAVSSHGTSAPNGSSSGGAMQGIVFSDVNGSMTDGILWDREFQSVLARIPSSVGVELLLDTCYSGGATRALPRMRKVLGGPRYLPHPKFNPKIQGVPKRARAIGGKEHIAEWAASSEDELSNEEYLDGRYHGLFTYVWVRNLLLRSGQPRGVLLAAVKREITGANYNQTPQLLRQ